LIIKIHIKFPTKIHIKIDPPLDKSYHHHHQKNPHKITQIIESDQAKEQSRAQKIKPSKTSYPKSSLTNKDPNFSSDQAQYESQKSSHQNRKDQSSLTKDQAKDDPQIRMQTKAKESIKTKDQA
jgi:hypothetical protein